jgi:hypothetical protein
MPKAAPPATAKATPSTLSGSPNAERLIKPPMSAATAPAASAPRMPLRARQCPPIVGWSPRPLLRAAPMAAGSPARRSHRVAEGQLADQPVVQARHGRIPGRCRNQHGHRIAALPALQQIQHEAQHQNGLAGLRLAEHHQSASRHSRQHASQLAAPPGQFVGTGSPGGAGVRPSAAFHQRHQGGPPVDEREVGRLPADRQRVRVIQQPPRHGFRPPLCSHRRRQAIRQPGKTLVSSVLVGGSLLGPPVIAVRRIGEARYAKYGRYQGVCDILMVVARQQQRDGHRPEQQRRPRSARSAGSDRRALSLNQIPFPST